MTETKTTKKTNSELALEAHKKQVQKEQAAKKSEIVSILGKTKDVTIGEGTDHEYVLTLQYPGTARALEIMDLSANKYDHIAYSIFMQEAIKDVIISPKITSLSFWDKHKYSVVEAAVKVLSFLNEGLDGNL
ncbi:MAG: hypothetical protein J6586_00200 [Snodgrassella sp.]|nr:hypothetical protein [Snodgrassella sp.]